MDKSEKKKSEKKKEDEILRIRLHSKYEKV